MTDHALEQGTVAHAIAPALVARMAAVSTPAAALRALPLGGLLSVRARGAACSRVAAALGVTALPGHGPMGVSPAGRIIWLRPDEWLMETPSRSPAALVLALSEAVRDGSPEAAGTVVELSASRHRLELSGTRSREVLASVCSLDLHPRVFPVGHATQTLLARVPVLLQLVDSAPTWRLLVRPSLVAYVVEWLTDAMDGM